MKNKFSIQGLLLLGLTLIIIQSCNMRGPQMPTWLEGTWTTNDTIGLVAESWEVINSDFMSGEGLFITRDDKTIIEVLSIFIRDGVLYYAALLPDQNKGAEIIFMPHVTVDHIGHRFEPSVWMGRKPGNVITRIVGTEFIQHQERVETRALP